MGEVSDWVHLLFIKYGRGKYMGPVCSLEIKKNIKFKTTIEYSNTMGAAIAATGGDIAVDGGIFAKEDFKPVLTELGIDFDDKSKKKQHYYVAMIDGTYDGGVLKKMYEKIPYATILLNLKSDGGSLKCKKKPPKPGKDKILDFCSGQVNSSQLGFLKSEIFWDAGEFSQACVENQFIIEELEIPKGVSSEEARLKSKRIGKLERTIELDGNKTVSIKDFSV